MGILFIYRLNINVQGKKKYVIKSHAILNRSPDTFGKNLSAVDMFLFVWYWKLVLKKKISKLTKIVLFRIIHTKEYD